jgi:hypothetical protein
VQDDGHDGLGGQAFPGAAVSPAHASVVAVSAIASIQNAMVRRMS